jgi:hypothetical protein
MGSDRLSRSPHPRLSQEQARAARARAWGFVFRCWQDKQTTAERAPAPNGRDGTTVQGDSANGQIIRD